MENTLLKNTLYALCFTLYALCFTPNMDSAATLSSLKVNLSLLASPRTHLFTGFASHSKYKSKSNGLTDWVSDKVTYWAVWGQLKTNCKSQNMQKHDFHNMKRYIVDFWLLTHLGLQYFCDDDEDCKIMGKRLMRQIIFFVHRSSTTVLNEARLSQMIILLMMIIKRL